MWKRSRRNQKQGTLDRIGATVMEMWGKLTGRRSTRAKGKAARARGSAKATKGRAKGKAGRARGSAKATKGRAKRVAH